VGARSEGNGSSSPGDPVKMPNMAPKHMRELAKVGVYVALPVFCMLVVASPNFSFMETFLRKKPQIVYPPEADRPDWEEIAQLASDLRKKRDVRE